MACWDKEINTKSQSFPPINLPCGAILLMLHKRSKLVRVSSTEWRKHRNFTTGDILESTHISDIREQVRIFCISGLHHVQMVK